MMQNSRRRGYSSRILTLQGALQLNSNEITEKTRRWAVARCFVYVCTVVSFSSTIPRAQSVLFSSSAENDVEPCRHKQGSLMRGHRRRLLW